MLLQDESVELSGDIPTLTTCDKCYIYDDGGDDDDDDDDDAQGFGEYGGEVEAEDGGEGGELEMGYSSCY
nr:hypothetical protein HmN_000243300 [Hymenolepis microstoma]